MAVITIFVTIIGLSTGNRTRNVICQKLHPSIIAASSISLGTPFTKLQNVITVNGILSEIKIHITEKKVPYIFNAFNKKKIEAIWRVSGLESNPGFKITPLLALRGLYGVVFGDIFMKCVYRMRPYEKVPGTTDALHEKWKKRCKDFVSNGYPHRHTFKKLCRQMIQEFDQ